MIVVSDAGPLVYLGGVGQLALLQDRFGRVVVLQQVWDKVVGAGAGCLGSAAVVAASWIDVRTPASSSLTERLHEQRQGFLDQLSKGAKELSATRTV